MGAFQGALAGGRDAFVPKLNATGTALSYSTYLGGAGTDVGNAIATDGTGAAYITGSTTCASLPCVLPPADFPTTAGVVPGTRPGGGAAPVPGAFPPKPTPARVPWLSTLLRGAPAEQGVLHQPRGRGHVLRTRAAPSRRA